MPTLVADCPRCGANDHTFDVKAHVKRPDTGVSDWSKRAEIFSVCRRCDRPTTFIIQVDKYEKRQEYDRADFWESIASFNQVFKVNGYVNIRENAARKPPEHLPADLAEVFLEGSTCLAVECYNAAGTMFRLCLDMATGDLLPPIPDDGIIPQGDPNEKQRRDLGLRLRWLIANGRLPADLADLAEVVREDGNDGAHAGTLSKDDAEDLADFTEVLLERLYTEPGRVALAKARRIERRSTH